MDKAKVDKAREEFRKKLITAPHDAFARYCLGFRDLARSFFRFALTGKQESLDLKKLKRLNSSHIDSRLNQNISDLLYSAPLKNDEEVAICLLVEHKSGRSESAPLVFQMRKQEVFIMEYLCEEHPQKLYPKVEMVGLYHGEQPYSGPASIAERMVVPPDQAPMRWQEKLNIVDMSQYSDEALLEQGQLGLFLLVLKHIYDKNIDEFTRDLLPRLRKMAAAKKHAAFLEAILSYLVAGSKKVNVSELKQNAVELLGDQVGGAVMTTAEMLIQKGEKRGEKRGEQRGEQREKIKIASNLIREGMSVDAIVRCTGLSVEQIELLQNNDKLPKND